MVEPACATSPLGGRAGAFGGGACVGYASSTVVRDMYSEALDESRTWDEGRPWDGAHDAAWAKAEGVAPTYTFGAALSSMESSWAIAEQSMANAFDKAERDLASWRLQAVRGASSSVRTAASPPGVRTPGVRTRIHAQAIIDQHLDDASAEPSAVLHTLLHEHQGAGETGSLPEHLKYLNMHEQRVRRQSGAKKVSFTSDRAA